MTKPQGISPSSCLGVLFFWWLWILGVAVCVAYIFGLMYMKAYNKIDSVYSVVFFTWNLLAIGTQGYLLLKVFGASFVGKKMLSELLFDVSVAAVGIPFIAGVGCGMLSNFAPRVAG